MLLNLCVNLKDPALSSREGRITAKIKLDLTGKEESRDDSCPPIEPEKPKLLEISFKKPYLFPGLQKRQLERESFLDRKLPFGVC